MPDVFPPIVEVFPLLLSDYSILLLIIFVISLTINYFISK